MSDKIDKEIEEFSIEEAEQKEKLRELLKRKAEDKLNLENKEGLRLLKKSKFYYGNNGELREHFATYKGYAIMIKQEKIKEDLNEKEITMFPTLVTLDDLRKMKRVNGNIVRKLQPETIHEYEKMTLTQGIITKIDEGI